MTSIVFSLVLTRQCNFRCDFCKIGFENKVITYDTLDLFINTILRLKSRDINMQIEFFGGEPLLEWKKIIYVVSKLKSRDITFKLVTNGLLLSSDKLDFIYYNHIDVTLSITKQNLPKLKKLNPYLFSQDFLNKDDLSINFILDPDFISCQDIKLIGYLFLLGYKKFLILPVQFTKTWKGKYQELEDIFHKIYLLQKYRYKSLSIDVNYNSLGNLYQKTFFPDSMTRSTIEATIDIDGKVYMDSETELYLIKDYITKMGFLYDEYKMGDIATLQFTELLQFDTSKIYNKYLDIAKYLDVVNDIKYQYDIIKSYI